MSRRARGGRGGNAGNTLGVRLTAFDERLDHLELVLYDLDPRTSQRTIDRVVELEKLTREHSNEVLRIVMIRKGEIEEQLKVADDLVKRSAALVSQGIDRLKRKGDEERKATTLTLQDLKDSVSMIDERVALALTHITETEQMCRELLGQAGGELSKCVAIKDDVALRSEQIESLLSNLQSEGYLEKYVSSKREVVRESRSPSLRRDQLQPLIARAQRVAGLRTRSVDRVVDRDAFAARWRQPLGHESAGGSRGVTCPPQKDGSQIVD